MKLGLSRVAKASRRARRLHSSSAFSVVELMLVMSIILLLAAIAIPRLLDAQKKSYEAGVVTFLRTLQSNQESYRLANGYYSDNFTDLGLIAFAPVAPGDSLAHDRWARLFAPWAQISPGSVYAAQGSQQPPAKTPPPPDTGQGGFGGQNPGKQPEKTTGGPGAPAGGGGAGGGGAGTSPGGTGVGQGPAGTPGGTSTGGTPSGGGTGGAPSGGGTNPPQTGGPGGSFSPSTTPGGKTNIVLKHNYIFTLERPTPTTWRCSAAPVRDRGQSKFFYFDQTGVIRVELGKFAGSTSPQL
jgi:type II secretory pathway pseudopilin PulG